MADNVSNHILLYFFRFILCLYYEKEDLIMKISSLNFNKLTREEKIDMYKFLISQRTQITASISRNDITDRGGTTILNMKIDYKDRLDDLILDCSVAFDEEGS